MDEIDLAPFWLAADQVRQEHTRLRDYADAARFWATYDAKLRKSVELLSQVRKDMEHNTQWTGDINAASSAFYRRVDRGVGSILRWLDADTAAASLEFGALVRQLDDDFRAVTAHRDWLVEQYKVAGTEITTYPELIETPVFARISDQDRGTVTVEDSNIGPIAGMIQDAMRRRDELARQFEKVRLTLEALPHNEKWPGPTTLATGKPPGPGGDPTASGANPASPSRGPTPPGGDPAAPGANPENPSSGPTPPNAAGTGPTGASAGPGSDPGDAPGTSPPSPGGDRPADRDIGGGLGGGDRGPRIPLDDPVLAGAPAAPTLAPPPPPLPTPLPGTDPTGGPRIPGGNLPTTSHSLGAPALVSPLPPAAGRGGGLDPGSPPSRTPVADSPHQTQSWRTTPATPGAGAGPVEPSPQPSRAAPAEVAGRGGLGFLPPFVPPVAPSSLGLGSGVRPGAGQPAGGAVPRPGGRDSRRAGLRPHLQGRTGDRADMEPPHQPAHSFAGDDVLDEELWQVPGAAPPTPPQSRRNRQRGC